MPGEDQARPRMRRLEHALEPAQDDAEPAQPPSQPGRPLESLLGRGSAHFSLDVLEQTSSAIAEEQP
jgi:hypothetical protein